MKFTLSSVNARLGFIAFLLTTISFGSPLPAEGDAPFVAKEPTTPIEEFGLTIRSTPHRSPQEELERLYVPKGFQLELVASEPEIVKPLNIAFDKKGRLWVSQTHQYPFPSKEGEPATDSIAVLEDKDGDGTFETRKLFADDLNIPMGILPVDDGVLCFSIPNIWHLKDTDGDGVCDERKVLYGPFDTTRDTHGLVNSLRDGGDGWIYACHGFNNQSRIAGTDGHSVWLPSGNVFRFRLDGSRVELYSQGQVNPFGMTQDRWGNWFSADCHSKPISQLIRGGSYQSFGRPHDGLGFAPDIMDHLHGSTAIAGLAHTVDSTFPASMSDQLLSGNVMTCRVNRNQLVYQGATAKAVELPDLVTSDDPWFRPVDLVFGPDGHLYIADFYNGIIGHYEVPLDHPERDRTSGRIWRVRWIGEAEASKSSSKSTARAARVIKRVEHWEDLDKLDLKDTREAMEWTNSLQALSDSSASQEGVRWFARNVDRIEEAADPIAKQTFLIAFRRTLQNLSNKNSKDFESCLQSVIADAVSSKGASGVRLCHVLLNVLPACKDNRCTLASIQLLSKIADRDGKSKRSESIREFLWGVDRIADIVDDECVVPFLDLVSNLSSEAGSEGGSGEEQLIGLAKRLESIGRRQLAARGNASPQLKSLANQVVDDLAKVMLNSTSGDRPREFPVPLFSIAGATGDKREWGFEPRKVLVSSGQGQTEVVDQMLQSSFPLGENYTGRLTTPPFPAPKVFAFSLAGHSGNPPKADKQTFARLSLLNPEDGSLRLLFKQDVPSNDIAQPVRWDLSEVAGREVVFEVVDEDGDASYAWVAVGNFQDPRLAVGGIHPAWHSLRNLVELFGAPEKGDSFSALVRSDRLDFLNRFLLLRGQYRSAAPVQTMLMEKGIDEQNWDLLFGDSGLGKTLPALPLSKDSAKAWEESWDRVAPKLFSRLSARAQEHLVQQFATNRSALLKLAEWTNSGALPSDVLRVIPQSLWDSLSEAELDRFATARAILAQKQDRSEIVQRIFKNVQAAEPNRELGAKVFAEKCAQCHKFGGIGVVVGPQLEGIGNRGTERLLEDILWPDRNVDEAFRVSLVLLADGTSLTGLISDRNDQAITLVDPLGKRQVIPVEEIEQEKHSVLSLMPSNMEELMNAKELASLLEYLRTPASSK